MPPAPATVRLTTVDLNETREWPCSGLNDDGWETEESALVLALNLVPFLTDAIYARGAGSIEVTVRRVAR